MLKKDKTKEKNCLFFASDYHFEMISLPYINKSIKNNKEVIVISENNLENTINKLLLQVNLEDDEKDKILKIDWKNNDFDKFKEIKEADKEKRNTIVFIKGKENYIKNVNKNLENWIKDDNKIEIIDCYDINEIEEKSILKKYNQEHILNGYDNLDENKKQVLLNQIFDTDFELIKSLYANTKKQLDNNDDKIEPMDYMDKFKLNEKYWKRCN